MTPSTKEEIERHQLKCDEMRAKFKEASIDGPWMDEPDRVVFSSHGLNCLLLRNPTMFNWCGYVGVKKDHPNVTRLVLRKNVLFRIERSYWDDEDDDLDVHGGITFREECEEDGLFWFGFDCAHYQDFVPCTLYYTKTIPGYPSLSFEMNDVYRTVNFVRDQTEQLAKQLSEKKENTLEKVPE